MSTDSQDEKMCAEVAVPVPVKDPFSYLIPEALSEKARVGVRVRVPFKNRELTGYLVGFKKSDPAQKLKPILEVLDDHPVLSNAMIRLTQKIGSYYCSSWGEAIENALPKWIKSGKKAERAIAKQKDEALTPHLTEKLFDLTPDQERALDAIQQGLRNPNPKPILLYGVTGSGKSEVYIRAFQEVISQGKSAICLVPEIALTEQLKRFFLKHFGSSLEIIHSKLTDSERFLAWHRLETGQKRMVLGPRSAVFAPVKNLGLLVIDEEHEGSYKQETTPRYHAREVAWWRTQEEKALLVMGSATPSLETMYQCHKNAILRMDLTTRVEKRAMPQVQICDLKTTPGQGGKRAGLFSLRLLLDIEENLKKKEGTMLLLNRRGFSTHINCPRCGQIETCDSCHVSLTFHQEDSKLACHYCNFQKKVPNECSHCHSPLLKFAGFGTEKIESEIAARFPTARVARLDADTVKKRGSHEIILKDFRDKKIDILVGTQMIAKGFDFPHVTLVGVILADVGLMLPDFRSSERTFQLLTQVAGRAGRGNLPGRVIIQTYSPDHPSVRFAKNHDYLAFYEHECKERYPYHYPPYARMINIILRSKNEKRLYQYAMELRDIFRKEFLEPANLDAAPENRIEMIGPAPLPFYRLRGHFRWHIMFKIPKHLELSEAISQQMAKIKKSSLIQWAIDVDPLNIL